MRFWVLNLTGAALLAAGWMQGAVANVFMGDQTGMTFGIAAVFLVGLALAARGRWGGAEYVSLILPTLGLLGTVIGFSMALTGVAGDDIVLRDIGVHTALNTTIVGLSGSLWLGLLGRLK